MGLRWYHIFGFAAAILSLALLILPPEREEGILLARSGDADEAEKKLARVLAHNPADSVALLELAEGFMRAGRNDKANLLLERFLQSVPDPARFNQRIGKIYATGFEYEKALPLLAQEPQKNREDLVRLCLQAGFNDDAIRFLRLGLKGTAADVPVWKTILNLQQWQMNPEGIGEALDAVARLQPTVENYTEALDFFFWQHNTGKMREYAQALSRFPGNPSDADGLNRLRLLRGIWIRLKELKPAVDTAERILASGKATEGDYADLSSLQRWSGDNAAALATTQHGLERFPRDTMLLWNAITFSRSLKDYAATARYETILAEVASDPALLRSAAASYEQAGDLPMAGALYKRLSESGNGNGRDQYQVARLYHTAGKKAETDLALGRLTDYLLRLGASDKRPPADEEDEALLADSLDLLADAGRPNDRQKLLEEYTKHGNPEATLLLCELLVATGQPQEALALLLHFPDAATAPQHRRALTMLAGLYINRAYGVKEEAARQQLAGEAILAIRRAVAASTAGTLSPQEKANEAQSVLDLRQTLVDLLILTGALAEAGAEIDALPAPDPAAIVELAAAYADANDLPNTRRWLKRVPANATLPAPAMARYGQALLTVGANSRAVLILEQADKMTSGKEKNVRVALARAYGATGRIAEQYAILDFYTAQPGATEEDWIAAADARDQQEDVRGGLRILELALMKRPDSGVLKARQVSLLSYMGLRQEARTAAGNLSGMRIAKQSGPLLTVAYALMSVDQLREAARVLSIAAALPKPGPEVVLARARCAAARRELRQSLPLYQEYLALRDNDPAAWLELAQLRQAMGLYGQREAALQGRRVLQVALSGTGDAADELHEQTVRAASVGDLLLAGGIADFLGEREEAVRNQQAAAARQPDIPARPTSLASLYNAYGKPRRAATLSQDVLHYNPDLSQPKRELATAQMSQRQPRAAAQSLRAFLTQEPGDAAARADLGYTLNDAGKWRQAAESFEAAARTEERPRPVVPARRAELLCEEITVSAAPDSPSPAAAGAPAAPDAPSASTVTRPAVTAASRAPSTTGQADADRTTSPAAFGPQAASQPVPQTEDAPSSGKTPPLNPGTLRRASEIDPDMLVPLSFAGGRQ